MNLTELFVLFWFPPSPLSYSGLASHPLPPCLPPSPPPPSHTRPKVFVMKQDFKFHCAHFVAFKGYRERLHGHNYTVGVRMRGTRRGHDG